MLLRHNELEYKIRDLKSQINNLPKGKLICSRNGNYYKWYHYIKHNKNYIPKKNRLLAEQLAYKEYLSNQLKDLSNEQSAISQYLNHRTHAEYDPFLTNPEFQALISSNFKNYSGINSDIINEWLNEPYEKNEHYPEQLIHKSISGNFVRSKSESIIDMLLFTNKIPFRYECALLLDETTFFPDFTILHPTTHKIYYWEHFGLMDIESYSKNAFNKLQIYANYNIFPTSNLITTYETKNNPLDIKLIEHIIQHYFS